MQGVRGMTSSRVPARVRGDHVRMVGQELLDIANDMKRMRFAAAGSCSSI